MAGEPYLGVETQVQGGRVQLKAAERYVYVSGITILMVVCLFLGWQWRTAVSFASSPSESTVRSKQDESATEMTRLKEENDRLRAEVETLRNRLEQAESRPIVVLPDVYVAEMKAKGMQDPVHDLLHDLQQRSDLIPFKGIAGGTMKFYPWLINRHWVIAGVGDGHIGGWAVLQYEVENGVIKWSLLASARE
jgi:hypothetical protein